MDLVMLCRQEDIEKADAVVCVSEEIADRVVQKYGIPNIPLRILKLTEGEHTKAIRAGGNGEAAVKLN